MITRTDALNDALERLDEYGYLDAPGIASHAPMAAEALSSLGYDHEVGAWVESYKARHSPMAAPPRSARIDPDDPGSWRNALGDLSRASDWHELFAHAVREQQWTETVGEWVPRLLPGYGGGLTHGLLRSAHAVRGLPAGEAPTDLALEELAKGLAMWAAFYHPLPGLPGAPGHAALEGSVPLAQAITNLPRPPEPWSPMDALTYARLPDVPGWEAAVGKLEAPPDLDHALSDLTATFCRVLGDNPAAFSHWLVHLVTPAAAIRTLLPRLPDLAVETVYAHLWHVNAALVTGFLPLSATASEPSGNVPSTAGDRVNGYLPTPGQLSARAAEHGDFHVIKFTEAALREHAIRPDPAYLRAAKAFIDHAEPW